MSPTPGTDEPELRAAPLPAGAAAVVFDSSSAFPPARRADLELAARAALAGGRATLPFYRSVSLRTADKGAGGPVTEADHAANDAILRLLAGEAPDDPVLSEESPPPPAGAVSRRLWVVDPLDGTREFIDGIDEFAVMVGLAEDGEASVGAVFVPGNRRLYVGVAEGGAWFADCDMGSGAQAPGRVSGFQALRAGAPMPGRTRLVRSRSHPDETLLRIEQALPGVEVIPSGSVGVKCARIAEREADLYVHPVPYLKEWDTCAPEAVLRGAGGIVTDCRGEALRYGKPDPRQPRGILAGDPRSWADALGVVREAAAPIL